MIKKCLTFILLTSFSFIVKAQVNSHDINNNNPLGYTRLFVAVYDGIIVDPYYTPPLSIRIDTSFFTNIDSAINNWKLDWQYKTGFHDVKSFKIVNTKMTKMRKLIYEKVRGLPKYSNKINLPIIVNTKLYSIDNYELLDKMDPNRIKKISFIEGKAAVKKYDKRLIFGAIVVSY